MTNLFNRHTRKTDGYSTMKIAGMAILAILLFIPGLATAATVSGKASLSSEVSAPSNAASELSASIPATAPSNAASEVSASIPATAPSNAASEAAADVIAAAEEGADKSENGATPAGVTAVPANAGATDPSESGIGDSEPTEPEGAPALSPSSTVWDGTTTAAPSGGGTAGNPYLIYEPAELAWISAQEGNDFTGKHFKLMNDIDLGGHPWKPIRCTITGVESDGTTTFTGFKGNIDGNGHSIKNLKVLWNDLSQTAGFGFICYFNTGTVKNLTFENAHITRTANGDIVSDNDIKMGILCGAVGLYATIQNVNLVNCRIDDGTDANGISAVADGRPLTIYAGGLVGDIANSFGGYSTYTNTAVASKITNVVSQVDFDFSVTTRETTHSKSINKYCQFNVGGIVGRIRRVPVTFHNVLYTGKVKAPIASIGPIYGAWRYNGETKITEFARAYAGELNDTTERFPAGSEPHDYYFYNYKIWNSAANSYEDITATYPIGSDDRLFGVRTFSPNNLTGNFTLSHYNDPTFWASFQGVNQGTSIDAVTDYGEIQNIDATLGLYNSANSGSSFLWSYDAEHNRFYYNETSSSVVLQQDDVFSFRSDVDKHPVGLDPASLNYRWSVVVRKSDLTWLDPIVVFYDENPTGAWTSQFTITPDLQLVLNQYINEEIDIFDRFFLRVDVLIHEDENEVAIPLTNGGQPVYAISGIQQPRIALQTPTIYFGEGDYGNGIVTLGSFHLQPTVKVGDIDVTYSDRLSYEWFAEMPDGTWRNPQNPYNIEGSVDQYIYPSSFDRRIKIVLHSADMGYPMNEFITTLPACPVEIHAMRPEQQDEQVYGVVLTSPYDGKVMAQDLVATWTTDIPIGQYSIDAKSQYLTVRNSDLDPAIASYTLVATYTQLGIPTVVEYRVNRLMLYETEGRDASNTQCLRAILALKYGTDATPNKFTGNVGGEWKWYVGNLLDAETSLHEVTDADGLTIVTDADGLESRLYGYDNDHYYRVEWVSNPADYSDVAGNAVTLVADITQAVTLYVYDAALTAGADADATTFDGLDPDGVPYPDGNDANDGKTPWTALKTLEEAYRRLPAQGKMTESRIVVMGYITGEYTYRYRIPNGEARDGYPNLKKYAKPVTVCGKYYEVERNGKVKPGNVSIDYHGAVGVSTDTGYKEIGVGAPHTFADICIWSKNKLDALLYANRNDLIIDKGVTFKNFPMLTGKGAVDLGIDASCKIPEFSIIAGKHNYNEKQMEDYVNPLNMDPYLTTVIIRSGSVARIIGTARNNTANGDSKNIAGSPVKPFRSHVVIDIDDDNNKSSNAYYRKQGYTHDIALVTGGQTDGSVWGDVSIEIRKGHINRYISGNISYGRIINGAPDDSFFGRTELNLYGGSVDELYGGSLGRYANTTTEALYNTYITTPYFYGQSVINIYDGTIRNNVYAAGAGGVIGIGHKSGVAGILDYSPDEYIPYYDGTEKLCYGPYSLATAANSRIPEINVRIRDPRGTEDENDTYDNFSHINIENSHVEVNVYGGTIYGNVYGGGYGFSTSMTANRVPYGIDDEGNKIAVAGNVYGTGKVYVGGGHIFGNVYGGGAGSAEYAGAAARLPDVDYNQLATVYGSTDVQIDGGIIGKRRQDFDGGDAEITDLTRTPLDFYDRVGNVYGGGQGLPLQQDMAAVYGNTDLHITGGTIMGNVFAGGDFADVRFTPGARERAFSGNTSVVVDGGILGNSIFGGSRGSLGDNASTAHIAGDSYVTVNDGVFLGSPFINEVDRTHGYRNFNIYGGGYLNCIIDGTAHVTMNTSLMNDEGSFMIAGENPNEWPDAVSNFQRAYMDITYRRFCVYGGGYGEHTRVLNTDVNVYISELLNKPHGITLAHPYYKQSLFDIAGGGYSGDVGYWQDNGLDPSDPDYESHYEYVGGDCNVFIDGYTYARKVIGGGFYGTCNNTNSYVRSGSLRQIYGGSLLGYVHNRAKLTIGSLVSDFLDDFQGDFSVYSETELNDAARKARSYNNLLYVTENVYAGNDVKGIIGTTRWLDPDGRPARESTDGAPLFAADVDPYSGKGIEFNIYGGTFMGDVYCAGNGHYRGYYVPEWVRYNDGPARMYSPAITSLKNPDGTLKRNNDGTLVTGNVYRARPMVGCVKVDIRGNNATDDRIHILGDFFGGGRSCTIGQWNTLLPFEDPRRLVKGGFLNINFGSHIDVHGAVYMGADGNGFNTQVTIEPDKNGVLVDLDTFDGSTTKELERLGEAAYRHWYFNTTTNRYEPGFPAPGELDGNYGMTGEHMLRGYLKNIEMAGDLVVTFYDDPFEIDPATKKYKRNDDGTPTHKRWAPAEETVVSYDSNDLYFHDFFLGGRCGSMTNNVVMRYAYTDDAGNVIKEEQYGAIYRASIPSGVTITNSVVMGSRDASSKIYPHNSDFTALVTEQAVTEKDDKGHDVTVMKPIEPWYTYDGGIVTQSPLTYDIIAYNDMMAAKDPNHVRLIALPDNFYTTSDPDISAIRDADSYTMVEDGATIYRKKYTQAKPGDPTWKYWYPNWSTATGYNLGNRNYDLAVTYDAMGREYAYAGVREDRDAVIAVKGAIRCNFSLEELPKVGPGMVPDYSAPSVPGGGIDLHSIDTQVANRHINEGGLLYGGCYNSGVTMGDVVLIAAGSMLCEHVQPENYESFSELATLKHNIGRVYGGGYGTNTKIIGNTYINLLMDFRGLNVFGGGHGGEVTGSTHINYIGTEESYVYGAIYGGGLYGEVGTEFRVFDDDNNLIDCLEEERLIDGTLTGRIIPAKATNLTIVSGNATRVYGGACLADIYGSTNIELMDQAVGEIDHLDMSKYLLAGDVMEDMTHARLIVGHVYGGNDIAGTIHAFGDPDTVFDTNITVREYEKSDGDERMLSPGSYDKHNGFPLIGTLYGGSNGDYGRVVDGRYAEGSTKDIYIGQGDYVGTEEQRWVTLDLNGTPAPNVGSTNINIVGGTIVSAYCGGNNATVTDRAKATVNYSTINARAGFDNTNGVDDPKRIWNLMELSSDEQFEEVLSHQNDKEFVYKYQIYHFFSGNDNADMAIQPEVHLLKGHIGSAYGGGNNGRMTYWRREGDGDPNPGRNHGVALTIDSPDVHIENLYGGGRIGDIEALDPATGEKVHFGPKEYGATLNVYAGLIEAVYGGNDVCGSVHNGTNVNIYGAISGDVYGAGNGNYLYQLDDSLEPDSGTIIEGYDDVNYGGRYFRVPPKSIYGQLSAGTSVPDDLKIMMINSYRPNVEKAYLNIQGSKIAADDPSNTTGADIYNRVWVKGNVYCGGNSSTIRTDVPLTGSNPDHNTIRFNIGDYVVLNGVFLGSNGESLADTRADGMMMRFERLNDLQLNQQNKLDENALPDYDKAAASTDQYPFLLSLYMRAVEVNGVPDEFNFNITKEETFIGDFCLGGNRGSMMTDGTIKVTLPEELTIYGNIVGGCYNTAFDYQGAPHSGGMTQYLRTGTGSNDQQSDIGVVDPTLYEHNKVWLILKNHFYPLRIKYPVEGDIFKIDLELDLEEAPDGSKYYGRNRCNVYGGCYNSGLTVGDIRIDLMSDMAEHANLEYVLNGIDRQVRALDVVGAGFGKRSMVIGDTKVRMRPGKNKAGEIIHPRCAAIFGGSQEGRMLGNTFVAVRDGQVLTNVYGGSESAILEGSTNVIIGYPEFYRCNQSGIYYLRRTDNYSETSGVKDANGNEVVKKKIYLLDGDVVAANVYEMITAYDPDSGAGKGIIVPIEGEKLKTYFTQTSSEPSTFGVTWDDIDIKIGMNNLYNFDETDGDTKYYGHGNVYGGGFVSNNSDVSLAGKPTVVKYGTWSQDLENTKRDLRPGYGGNAMIMISDNPLNGKPDFNGKEGMILRDHISIGTANLKKVTLQAGENKIGKYYIAPKSSGLTGMDRLFHQEAGKVTADDVAKGKNVFYEVEGDGGIYGGGRKVFVDGFRSCDLVGYGYAKHTPQHPKHLGTIQRLYLFTMTDCCMSLTGAPDYASSKIDATPYSMTRVGELRMESSIAPDAVLDTGTDLTLNSATTYGDTRMDKPGYMVHSTPRSRNYMGFFNQIRFVGAINSTTKFNLDGKGYMYHDENGQPVSGKSYKEFKEVKALDRDTQTMTEFPKRNVGTSHNMLGINNGYTFKVQGTYFENKDGNEVEQLYYGPVEGVVEVKLLTFIANDGGGYIYALNQHNATSRDETLYDDHFTEATGNFVFPGRIFSSGGDSKAHYMLDDCFPMGYDYMVGHEKASATDANPDGWKDEEVHYWYVRGNSYYFNTTLTAYTYNHPKDFFLNNYDNLIMLSGVEEGKANIKVKSVTWNSHDNDVVGSNYKCDLTGYERTNSDSDRLLEGATDAYQLYFTVDKNTEVNFKETPVLANGAFVSRIPRANFLLNEEAGAPAATAQAAADGTIPNAADNGTFNKKETAGDNMPVVGITLRDNIDNTSPEYYKEHLKDPHHVTLEIEADNNGVITNYTINLTIIYLQGPNIQGNIKIENCALPGEIVNANTGSMTVDLAEELVVEDRLWIVMPPDHSKAIDVTEYRNEFDYTKLELPVWYYNNDWDLFYRLKINGENFDVAADPDSDHPNITVHNYHRMKAMYGETEITQILTPGCRIFIEDDADFEKFIAYIDELSDENHVPGTLPGTSLVDGPKDSEGLMFILANNITIPARDNTFHVPERFGGALYGNGNNLFFSDTTPLLRTLTSKGSMRDIGFIGSAGEGYVVDEIEAHPSSADRYDPVQYAFTNCYFSAQDGNGGFNKTVHDSDRFMNCGQNCRPERAETYHYDEEFTHGRAAYNVNGYYLLGRYQMLEGAEKPTVTTIDNYYYPGDHRFAHYDPYGVGTAKALRTKPRPNYLNRDRTGLTNHNMAHLTDETYVEPVVDSEGNIVTEGYFKAVWPDDYFKFGQNLSNTPAADQYPVRYNGDNRVYRASGFYGSMQDRGFHFNKNAVAKRNTLTAIDFTGYRDNGMPNTIGRSITDTRDVMCSPMLDLPDPADKDYGILSFEIASASSPEDNDGVTRNLLVYTTTDAVPDIFSALVYSEDTAEGDIYAHVLDEGGDNDFISHNKLLHLVDKQDFNAPIAFDVEKRAWYERKPEYYSVGNTAWEGICLPFTANRVSAFGDPKADGASVLRDHGEITHFYGNDNVAYDTPNVYNRLHEYWLRSLVGMEHPSGSSEGSLVFGRPGIADKPFRDEFNNVYSEVTANYHYSNVWFLYTFGAEYRETHNRYTAEGVDMPAYRFLTAEIPYIVTFPADRYREFDLSGEFYKDNVTGEMSAYPMTIRYEYITGADRNRKEGFEETSVGSAAALPYLTIGVSDDASRKVRADNGSDRWLFQGTFMHTTLPDASYGVIDEGGMTFRRCNPDEEVLPFRAYVSAPAAITAPQPIASPAADPIVTPDMEDDEDEYNPTDIEFSVEHNVLVIRSPRNTRIALCDISGRLVRMLDIRVGRNEVRDLDQGVYLAGRFKFLLH